MQTRRGIFESGKIARVDLEPVVLRPNRLGSYLGLAFGLACAGIAAVMLASGNGAGYGVAALAVVGVAAGGSGLIPGRAFLRLDGQGFYVKSIAKSFGARWVEIDAFEPQTVRMGRRGDVPVVAVSYRSGIGDAHVPGHRLERGVVGIDERYVVAAYGGLSNGELAALLERYRDRYG
jgi:hypothetical protein